MPENKTSRFYIRKVLSVLLIGLGFGLMLYFLSGKLPLLYIVSFLCDAAMAFLKKDGKILFALLPVALSAFSEYIAYGTALCFIAFFFELVIRLHIAAKEEKLLSFSIGSFSALIPAFRIFTLYRELLLR
ncbi:MAG: hypothetical protein E7332_06045 [Clostridiales bacterium]|nr:hypothetical protein [Clostridiales bacterium]